MGAGGGEAKQCHCVHHSTEVHSHIAAVYVRTSWTVMLDTQPAQTDGMGGAG